MAENKDFSLGIVVGHVQAAVRFLEHAASGTEWSRMIEACDQLDEAVPAKDMGVGR